MGTLGKATKLLHIKCLHISVAVCTLHASCDYIYIYIYLYHIYIIYRFESMDIFTKLRSFTFVIHLFIYIERDIAYCEVTTPRQRNREVGDPTEKGTLRRTTAPSGDSLFCRAVNIHRVGEPKRRTVAMSRRKGHRPAKEVVRRICGGYTCGTSCRPQSRARGSPLAWIVPRNRSPRA